LDYDFYQACIEQEFCNIVKTWPEYSLLSLPEMQKFYKKLHFKSLLVKNFYDLTLLVHSEKNSYQVEKYMQNNFVPVYYWSHAVIARDWFRFAQHDPLINTDFKITDKTFLIYNRAWSGSREYRLKFAEQLVTTNLYQNCITSFSEFDGEVQYSEHQLI
jgi:hypothetical protein